MKKMAKISVRVTKNVTLLLCYLVTLSLTACTLFVDDEDLPGELPTYEGKGYDEEVHEEGDFYDITYKYKSSTIVMNADHELTKHIVKVESNEDAGLHVIYFDGSTPKEILPKPMQGIISNNLDLFQFGLCDMVHIVKEVGGQYVVTCKHVEVQEIFDDLQFSARIPFDEYVEAYDLCDDEGNVVAHVENGKVVEAKSNGRKDSPSFTEKDGGLNVDIPFDIKDFKSYGTVDGGFNMILYCDVDFSWDGGFRFALTAQDGEFKIGYNIKISKGVDDPIKLLGFDAKVPIPIGPTGIIVYVAFGGSLEVAFGADIEANFYYKKAFEFTVGYDGEDFLNECKSPEGEFEVDMKAYGQIQFPILKLHLGFAIGTSAITYRAELYLTLETNVSVSSVNLNFTTGETDIQTNPKIDIDLKIGFAVAVVAEGKVIASILKKVKTYIKDKLAKIKPVKKVMKYAGSLASRTALTKLLEIRNNPSASATFTSAEQEYLDYIESEMPGYLSDPDNIEDLLNKELNGELIGLPSEIEEINDNSGIVDLEDNGEAALRLGPFYPDVLTFDIYDNYLFPKMKEGSLRVGRKWNADQTQLVFTPEFTLETPGLLSIARDFYPGFLIKLGSEEIMFMPANNSEKLTFNTPRGKIFKAEIPSLEADHSYTLVPCYATTSGGDPSIFDKAITFSATTPSMSITDLKVTTNSYVIEYDENINPTDVLYTYKFDTYTSVVGSRNVREWGIIDLMNTDPNTRVHTSSTATLQSGRYIHHWSVKNTRKSKIVIQLQPYIFAKDSNKSDWSEAKMFERFIQTISSEYDFTDSKENSYVPAWQQDYKVQLDSVTFEPDVYAEY